MSSEPATKKQKVADTEESLLEEIDQCQNEIDALNEQASEEILKIEQKYNKLRRPFYENRSKIIAKVDKFWVTTFINHPRISSIMQDQEEDCLHYCYKLNVEDFDDVKTGYSISFHFKENPYFENEVITKEYHLASENQSNSDFTQSSTSTPIKWKEGKDLLKEMQSKPQANKKRDIETKSFFDWFCDNSDPMDDMAELIKDDIWPNPLQYFLVPDIGVYNEEDSVGDEDDEINGSGVEDDEDEDCEEEPEDDE